MVTRSYLVSMNVHINQLVRSLLQKDSIEHCTLQELQQFADSNPHFGAAQLLLTKKLKTENSDRYNEQLQKTFLYFHNPMWVEHLLNETGNAIVNQGVKKTEETPSAPVAIRETALAEIIVELPSPLEETEKIEKISTIKEEEFVVGAEEPAIVTMTAAEQTSPDPSLINPALAMEQGKDDLLFEPYHTVDYFASQGIKLKEEEKPADKFSQQLRSFTDWLKTLKKLPVTDMAKQPETYIEKKVEQMAAHSLQDGDIVTEAMAEVWEKQGNASKALALYTKLSLLEPAKSTYFAAKIEELKKQL